MQEGIQEGVEVSKCGTSGLLEESGIVFWGQSLPLKCLKQESDVIALVVSKKIALEVVWRMDIWTTTIL